MSAINYKELQKYLQDLKQDSARRPAPVYLIYGEEWLVKRAFKELLDDLVPAGAQPQNYELYDRENENIAEIIQRVNTYSLFAGRKIIAVVDSKIFDASRDQGQLLETAKRAYDASDMQKAAQYFLRLMGRLKVAWEDVETSHRDKILNLKTDPGQDTSWLEAIIAYCRDNQLKIPAVEDGAGLLQQALEKGFPANNHLIITTETADKRQTLFKTIARQGVVIDCAVPKGDRRADKIAQEAVLAETMQAILHSSKKTVDRGAYAALCELTGFDLRTFSSNLEKLISYVGDRDRITAEDVQAVLKRTKKDPIYDLTNAIAERKPEQALFFLDSLLADEFHPLQILTAVANQIRKLLLVKDFVESSYGTGWQAACPYRHFENNIMPAIAAYDQDLLHHIESWEDLPTADGTEAPAARAFRKRRKARTDLLIAKSPKNTYPVYQLLKKSENFAKQDLMEAVATLTEADLMLKSSGQPPKLILEDAILRICRSAPRV
ncbi:MAG: hypothetical protein JSW39_07330 [Desulfobacterales bacterium]|nr:MAG: hypothetical protein JSW39_07330 [Desulfobacterales bacterium]